MKTLLIYTWVMAAIGAGIASRGQLTKCGMSEGRAEWVAWISAAAWPAFLAAAAINPAVMDCPKDAPKP